MIVHVAGTHGSGKTHLVNRALRSCAYIVKMSYRPPRWLGSIGVHGTRSLFVPGTWEHLDALHAACMIHHELACDVLREGGRLQDLRSAHDAGVDVRVVMIDHPVQDCASYLRETGQLSKIDTLTKTRARVLRSLTELERGGVPIHKLSRESARQKVMSWLELS